MRKRATASRETAWMLVWEERVMEGLRLTMPNKFPFGIILHNE